MFVILYIKDRNNYLIYVPNWQGRFKFYFYVVVRWEWQLYDMSLRNQSFITILHQSSKVTEVSPSRICQSQIWLQVMRSGPTRGLKLLLMFPSINMIFSILFMFNYAFVTIQNKYFKIATATLFLNLIQKVP